jgi:hypothetical protein
MRGWILTEKLIFSEIFPVGIFHSGEKIRNLKVLLCHNSTFDLLEFIYGHIHIAERESDMVSLKELIGIISKYLVLFLWKNEFNFESESFIIPSALTFVLSFPGYFNIV